MLTWLPASAPLSHRLAHRLATSSFRGHRYYWALAHRLSRFPSSPSVLIGSRYVFSLPLEPEDILEVSIYHGTHEQAEMLLASRIVRPGGTCLDIGANIGLYTLLLAALVGPEGRVVAFEPSPDTRARLERTCTDISGITILPFALGAEESVQRLAHFDGTHAWSTLRCANTDSGKFSHISVRRLDDVDEVGGSEPIDFLKLDVEGWESEVLKGATNLFSSGRICSALVEVSPLWDDTGYIEDLVGRHGYHGFVVGTRKSASRLRLVPALFPYRSSPGSQFDLLLVRADKLSLVADFVVD